MNHERSSFLFQQAKAAIPGGVNSPVRAFKSVGADPLFIMKASGSHIYDEDGNNFIDYVGSWGPMIAGHCHPDIIKAVQDTMTSGASFGAPTVRETTLADMVIEAVPSIEMVRMVSSGTEATMSAIRLARGYTGRDKILKFSGCYHGHADSLLVKAGSGAATFGVPDSPGVPAEVAKLTLTAEFNSLDSVRKLVAENSGGIACIWDPDDEFAPRCNMGMVELEPVHPDGNYFLHDLVAEHARRTGSPVALGLLDRWEEAAEEFVVVIPPGFRAALAHTAPPAKGRTINLA